MATLQQQARALGDPTRHDIFRYIADAAAAVHVAELTDRFGLNHNAIRQHLAKLVDAGLVVEGKAPPAGRGRPRLQYWLHPTAESQWGVNGPYERLSSWLTEVIRTGDTPVEVGRRVGRRRLHLGPGADGDPVTVLVNQMHRHGFDPVVATDAEGASEITLRNCPFTSVVLADPDTVCSIHMGIALGIADSVDGLVIDELIPTDPRRPHCRLRCHRDPVSIAHGPGGPAGG